MVGTYKYRILRRGFGDYEIQRLWADGDWTGDWSFQDSSITYWGAKFYIYRRKKDPTIDIPQVVWQDK